MTAMKDARRVRHVRKQLADGQLYAMKMLNVQLQMHVMTHTNELLPFVEASSMLLCYLISESHTLMYT